jgi:AcrR family transcriptional regulator
MKPDLTEMDPGWPYTKAKTAVLVAAAGVIREKGPRSATLKNIAARAGITEPAIFRHFDGVDGLFAGLFNVYERIFERTLECLTEEGGGLDGYFRAMGRIARIMAASHDFAYLVAHAGQVFSGYEDLKARTAKLGQKHAELAAASLRAAELAQELRAGVGVDTVVIAIAGVFHMTLSQWLDSGFAFDFEESCKQRLSDIRSLVSVDELR